MSAPGEPLADAERAPEAGALAQPRADGGLPPGLGAVALALQAVPLHRTLRAAEHSMPASLGDVGGGLLAAAPRPAGQEGHDGGAARGRCAVGRQSDAARALHGVLVSSGGGEPCAEPESWPASLGRR